MVRHNRLDDNKNVSKYINLHNSIRMALVFHLVPKDLVGKSSEQKDITILVIYVTPAMTDTSPGTEIRIYFDSNLSKIKLQK